MAQSQHCSYTVSVIYGIGSKSYFSKPSLFLKTSSIFRAVISAMVKHYYGKILTNFIKVCIYFINVLWN
jgi:hypothetical protein